MSQAVAFGSRVFVCDNLAFSGEQVVNTKNTTFSGDRLPRMVAGALKRFPEFDAYQRKLYDQMRNVKIKTTPEVHDILMSAAHAGATPYMRLKSIWEEWMEPEHKEFKDRTAWSLFNAFTTCAKRDEDASPFANSDRTIKLTGLFAERFKLAQPPRIVVENEAEAKPAAAVAKAPVKKTVAKKKTKAKRKPAKAVKKTAKKAVKKKTKRLTAKKRVAVAAAA
jgi:hypothetical protein